MSDQNYWENALRRRLSRRRLVRYGAVASGAVVLTAAGCTSSSGTTEPPKATSAPSGGTAATAAPALTPATTAAAQAVKRGGTFATGYLAPLNSYEVIGQVRTAGIAEMIGPCFNQLVRYRAQAFNDNTIVPDLADSWTATPDGKTWTFKLNPSAKWQNLPPVNGRAFTSADVKWMYDYIVNPQNRTWVAPLFSSIEEVQTPDPQTVVFRLKAPQANFLDIWAGGGGGFIKMLPREVFERDGNFEKTLVGTGPFMIDKDEKNVSFTGKRNPDYWKTGVDGRPLPYLDNYTVYSYRDPQQVTAQLLSGQYTTSAPGGANQADWPELEKAGIRLVETMPPSPDFVRINTSKPPFDKVEARKALALALDQKDMLQTLRTDGVGRIWGYIPPFFADYLIPQAEIEAKLKQDLAEARRLAQASGLTREKIKIISYLKLPGYYTDAPQYLQQKWKDIGVEVDVDWFPDAVTAARTQTAGDFQLLLFPEGFNGDLDNWVYGVWHSKSPTNFAKVNDPRVDKFAEDQRAEVDPAKRKQIVLDFQRYMMDQYYWIQMPHRVQKDAYQPYVRNFSRHWAFGFPGIEAAWFDK